MRQVKYFIVLLLISYGSSAQQKQAFGTADYIRAMKHATDVMVNDVASPVAASRYYAYISMAANEAVCQYNPQQPAPVGKMKDYPKPQVPPEKISKSDPGLAVILSIYEAGVKFLPSGYVLKKNIDSLKLVAAKRKMKTDRINATADVVNAIVANTLSFAYADGFMKLSGLRRYTPTTGDAYWQPTPPGFMPAIEPNWYTLRPFIIDSASQFFADPPQRYNTDSTSEFYRQMMEVYRLGSNLTKEQMDVAMFWDCNPFALQQVGHLEFGIKKISPGGHWMGIAGIACKKVKADLNKTAYVHSLLAASMADAFITCWNTKYRHNRVRPETAIKKLVDRNWRPLLQTPPFPEYTSGHSVVSTTSARILTSIFGENFAYNDDTEVEFGLPARKFASFDAAAKEAAISRLYGGIHFRDAIDNGVTEGRQIAEFILRNVPKINM